MTTIAISRTETLSDGFLRLDRVHLEQTRRDGTRQAVSREVLRQREACAVLPHDPSRGTVLLVCQLRLPALLTEGTGYLIEAAAGIVEHGSPEDTVREEAEQELGCTLRSLRPVFVLYSSPGASTERIHLFLAEYAASDRTGSGGGLAEEGEDIEVIEMPLADAVAMARRGEIVDMKTVVLLHAALLDPGSGPAA